MTDLRKAAEALVDRWDTPAWKDAPHTGVFIDALRAALEQLKQEEAKAAARRAAWADAAAWAADAAAWAAADAATWSKFDPCGLLERLVAAGEQA